MYLLDFGAADLILSDDIYGDVEGIHRSIRLNMSYAMGAPVKGVWG